MRLFTRPSGAPSRVGPAALLLLLLAHRPPPAPAFGPAPADQPRILSVIAGLYRCIGTPSTADGARWGCAIDQVAPCGGGAPVATLCRGCKPPAAIGLACLGQRAANHTSQDGTPVTFNLPVDMTTVKAEHFVWGFPDGTTRAASCVIRQGQPAGEPNEQQTLALIGDAGGWAAAGERRDTNLICRSPITPHYPLVPM